MHSDDGVISFDLVRGTASTLDVSQFFPVSLVHAIRSQKEILDSISPGVGRTLDLSYPGILSVSPMTRYHMLDIAPCAHAYRRGLVSRDDVIDLFPPLQIPYGALDTRGEPIISEKKYPDIYRRPLPWGLHARRMTQMTSRYLARKRRPIAYTLACSLVLTLPIVFYTKYLIESGYENLRNLKSAQTRDDIASHIRQSRGDFERANILFFPFQILPGESITLASSALYGGLALTRGLDHLMLDIPASATGATITEDELSQDDRYRPQAKNISPLRALGIDEPTVWMKEHRDTIEYLASSFEEAGRLYSRVVDIEHPRASEMAHIGRGLVRMGGLLEKYLIHESDVLALLGAETPERYIILNQNRDEIRANGGFPGSVITMTLLRGNIQDYRTDDVYYYDWNLYPFREIPPPGLALISGNYGLRDVNYYADFRTTLEKSNTFIERSGDPTVTVGIALHQGIIEDILGSLGPITLSGVTEPFVRENFSLLMSTLVESRYGEETSAKDILRRFVDAFVAKVHEKRAYDEVISTIETAVGSGEILFASRNEKIQEFFDTFRKPLPWERAETKENFAYPLLTSISGNKSDRFMERSYIAETTPIGQCRMLNKLTFTQRHTYNKDVERQIRSYMTMLGIGESATVEKMLSIQGNSKNIAYIRLLTPLGATLTGATAGVIGENTPKAREYAFTLETPVGSSASKTIRYVVDTPGCEEKSVPVSWYRQPGLSRTEMKSR